jgi:hypothetical protein
MNKQQYDDKASCVCITLVFSQCSVASTFPSD